MRQNTEQQVLALLRLPGVTLLSASGRLEISHCHLIIIGGITAVKFTQIGVG